MNTSKLGFQVAATLALVGAVFVSCGDDENDPWTPGGGGSSTSSSGSTSSGTTSTSSSGTYTGTDPNTDCAGKLDPVAPTGQVEVVGDGSAASCTEQALHDAVTAVNGSAAGGTITFDCGGDHTITLSSSVYVDHTMIIDGGGEITLSGGGAVRVIELNHHLDFVVQQIIIQDGYVPAGAENESGAGILHPWFGTFKAIDVRFENNHSASLDHDVGGGAMYLGGLTEAVLSGCTFINNSGSTGGGVLNRSTNLSVVDCVFFGNSATTWADSGQYGNGGGLYIDRMWLDDPIDFVICGTVFEQNHAEVHGSAFFSYNLEGSGAVFDRCTFKDNDMDGSPGGGTGSVYHQGVPLLLVNSTFSGNSTGSHAGGIFLGGGTDAQVVNCTFENNVTPGNAGALWAGNGNVQVENTTFHNNFADYGPAIFKGQSGTVTLTNVIFSNNTTDNEFSAVACHETFTDGGGNIQWPNIKNNGNDDTACAASVVFADPQLEALADNGGPTVTMALPGGSPAIDVAQDCPEFDQRGMPRVGDCDSGAYEYQPD
ncbi:MAG: hypothetical protein JRI68_02425 [Deltaproteobacteria bacterium]|nr:hypothetical protein [Deltaproteobacteria bacterium]